MQPVLWRRAFAAATYAWALLVVTAPFVASRSQRDPVADACVFAVYALGSAICHQRPERSFHWWGAQLPVCARCTGLYLGAALAPLAPAGRLMGRGVRAVGVLVLAAAPTVATLVYEWTRGTAPANSTRMAAGLWLGLGVARILMDAIH